MAIAANGDHTCAVLENGAIRCWGGGQHGQLGYGNTDEVGDFEAPRTVGNVRTGGAFRQVAGGDTHTCALNFEGQVRCWGQYLDGRLGYPGVNEDIGDNEQATDLPNRLDFVEFGQRVEQIAVGHAFSCARLSDGSVSCWGRATVDDDGTAGDEPNGVLGHALGGEHIGDNETPAGVRVALPSDAVELCAGRSHACAVLDNGRIHCWGASPHGQLGNGDTQTVGDDERPDTRESLWLGQDAVEVSCGGRHTCALLSGGRVACWGAKDGLGVETSGPLGDEARIDDRTPRVPLEDVVQVETGLDYTCALRAGGQLYCWGDNDVGQLGIDSTESVREPTLVSIDTDVRSVAVGDKHTCVIVAGRGLRCWGHGSQGRLGYAHCTPGPICEDIAVPRSDDVEVF